MNRALRAATAGVLLLSPLAISACSAGQVTQTATQDRDQVGAMAQVGDITVRAANLENPRGGSYDAGDDAELLMALVNGAQEDDTLVGVDAEGAGDVEIQSAGTATTVGSASGGAADSGEIEVPAGATVFVDGDDVSITLTDLDDELIVGQYLEVTLTFENAGEVTVPVTVATPDDVLDRDEAFDFHHEEEGGEEGSE